MMVVTLEYWPGADAGRSQHRGWAAVLREHRHGRHEWVVTLTLEGRRHLWSGPGTGTALGALVSALAAIGVLTVAGVEPGEVPSSPADLVRVVHGMTDAVESHLAGAAPQPVPTLGAGPAAGSACTSQRMGARQRVLALPMLSEQQVRDLFTGERDHPAIVRGLRKAGVILGLRHDGHNVYPNFQFLHARPHPIAAAVNLSLRADLDPWRAAIWWSSTNKVLGCRPLHLLARPDEHDRLLTAARAEGGGK